MLKVREIINSQKAPKVDAQLQEYHSQGKFMKFNAAQIELILKSKKSEIPGISRREYLLVQPAFSGFQGKLSDGQLRNIDIKFNLWILKI